MKTSETIVKIAAALVKAQKNMGAVKKGAANPFFKSKYADLASVIEACKEPLNDQGISIWQPHYTDESGTYVETVLLHESGEFISSTTQVLTKKADDPQAVGSGITYARRYGLQSLVNLPAEDDDGEKAMSRPTKPAPAKPAAKKSTFKKSKPEAPASW
jgi:hypothetical protein